MKKKTPAQALKDFLALEEKKKKIEGEMKDLSDLATKAKRKLQDKRKILVGAYFIKKHKEEGNYDELLKIMDDFLKRPGDRSAFDLEPLSATKKEGKNEQV